MEKIESEIDIKGIEVICVVHKGPIDGPIYLCPSCRTFYCQKCAMALKERQEKCWVCERKFEL